MRKWLKHGDIIGKCKCGKDIVCEPGRGLPEWQAGFIMCKSCAKELARARREQAEGEWDRIIAAKQKGAKEQ